MSDVYEELAQMTPNSQKIYERNAQILAQEVVGTIWMPYSFYATEAKGSKMIDADGNEYIDLTMGFGPLMLGHNPDCTVKAARETAEKALLLGIPNTYQGELAELLVEASPDNNTRRLLLASGKMKCNLKQQAKGKKTRLKTKHGTATMGKTRADFTTDAASVALHVQEGFLNHAWASRLT